MFEKNSMMGIFTYIGGVTLTEYLRKRRMSLAAVDLKNENAMILIVGLSKSIMLYL